MNLEEIKISNFRGIKEKEIQFKPGFNLIKGENGKGKTSILEAVAIGLGGYVAGIGEVATRHFSQNEIRHEYAETGDGSYDKKNILPIEVSISANLNGKMYQWTRAKSSINASRSTTQPRDICREAERMVNEDGTMLPLLLYLGAGRVWEQKREKSVDVFRKQYFRVAGYVDALVEASNIKMLLNWCVKMEQVSWQKEKKIAEYEAVKKAVADFMRHMEGDGEYKVFYDKQLEELLYEKDGVAYSIQELSAGYQSLIWMIFEIAYRMAVLNPDSKEKIAETTGIVLIDELDMHLHPKWQWNVIDALRKVFPNVQFIATTHAPILFASAKDVWVIDIENEEITYDYSHYGIDVNTSIKTYQDTSDVPAEVQGQIVEFENLMDEEEYDKAKNILLKLENDTAPAHPVVLQMRTRYEVETIDWEE